MKYKDLKAEEFNEINIKELTQTQFSTLMNHARSKSFSPFAHFCMMLKGFDLYYKKNRIDKWEAFYLGRRNAELILTNQSRVKAFKR
jgi:hypothetical protein